MSCLAPTPCIENILARGAIFVVGETGFGSAKVMPLFLLVPLGASIKSSVLSKSEG